MKSIPIIVCILILFQSFASGQDITKEQPNKNITNNMVYVDLGAGLYVVNFGINYERTIFSGNGSTISLKGTYGLFSCLIPVGDYYGISGHYSFGRRFINIETAIGISLKDSGWRINPLKFNNIETSPLFYLGCRLKKPTGNCIMKIGVGYPQALSWGFGIAF